MDNLIRVAADEALFATGPFAPDWLRRPEYFDAELAELPVRLTNFFPDRVHIDTGRDLSRQVYVHFVKGR